MELEQAREFCPADALLRQPRRSKTAGIAFDPAARK
jgi:hypothetical protein